MKAKNSPARRREVQRRARQIMQDRGWGYGKAMRMAGWVVARAAKDGSRRRAKRGY